MPPGGRCSSCSSCLYHHITEGAELGGLQLCKAGTTHSAFHLDANAHLSPEQGTRAAGYPPRWLLQQACLRLHSPAGCSKVVAC